MSAVLGFLTTAGDWLAPLFSLAGVSSFTGIAICALVIWLGGPKAKLVAMVAAAIFAAFYIGNMVGDYGGAERIQTRWDAANARIAAAAKKRDEDIAAAALKSATEALAEIENLSKEQMERITEYAAELARNGSPACRLTRADLERLQSLRRRNTRP